MLDFFRRSVPNSASTPSDRDCNDRAKYNSLPEANLLLKGIFRTKNLDDILSALGDETHRLKRSLGPLSITLLGIGAIIGAGIFATVGTAAAGDPARPGAGPSLMLSFGITAVVCAFTALCYAEMAAMVPISGSAYT
jgi:APA family basic amino acid/polyamine antiporter